MQGRFLKSVSLITAAVFSITQFSFPERLNASVIPSPAFNFEQASSRVSAAAPFRLSIPKELAAINNIHSGVGPKLIHIQTSHMSFEAQKKIKSILKHLEKEEGIKTLFLEGTAFKLDPSLLRFFPTRPDLNEKALEQLSQKSLVDGAELFLADSQNASAYGIEDAEVYKKGTEIFRDVLRARRGSEQFLKDFDQQISRIASTRLNPKLRDFLKECSRYTSGTNSPSSQISFLKQRALETLELEFTNPVNQVDWPMLVRLTKLEKWEKEINQAALKKEKDLFLAVVSKKLTPSLAALIEELLSSPLVSSTRSSDGFDLIFEEMADKLPRDFNYAAYPNLNRAIGFRLLNSEIDPSLLMKEVEQLSQKIAESLAQSQTEKKILDVLNKHRLLRKLFALELGPDDYEEIQQLSLREAPNGATKQSQFWIASSTLGTLPRNDETSKRLRAYFQPSQLIQELLALCVSEHVSVAAFDSHLGEIDQLFRRALDFYAVVKERDQCMIRNVERRFKETGVDKAVVITGGFHSRPFQEYFSKHGYRYALLSPNFTSGSKEDSEEGKAGYIRFILETDPRKLETQTHAATPIAQDEVNFAPLGYDFKITATLVRDELRATFGTTPSSAFNPKVAAHWGIQLPASVIDKGIAPRQEVRSSAHSSKAPEPARQHRQGIRGFYNEEISFVELMLITALLSFLSLGFFPFFVAHGIQQKNRFLVIVAGIPSALAAVGFLGALAYFLNWSIQRRLKKSNTTIAGEVPRKELRASKNPLSLGKYLAGTAFRLAASFALAGTLFVTSVFAQSDSQGQTGRPTTNSTALVRQRKSDGGSTIEIFSPDGAKIKLTKLVAQSMKTPGGDWSLIYSEPGSRFLSGRAQARDLETKESGWVTRFQAELPEFDLIFTFTSQKPDQFEVTVTGMNGSQINPRPELRSKLSSSRPKIHPKQPPWRFVRRLKEIAASKTVSTKGSVPPARVFTGRRNLSKTKQAPQPAVFHPRKKWASTVSAKRQLDRNREREGPAKTYQQKGLGAKGGSTGNGHTRQLSGRMGRLRAFVVQFGFGFLMWSADLVAQDAPQQGQNFLRSSGEVINPNAATYAHAELRSSERLVQLIDSRSAWEDVDSFVKQFERQAKKRIAANLMSTSGPLLNEFFEGLDFTHDWIHFSSSHKNRLIILKFGKVGTTKTGASVYTIELDFKNQKSYVAKNSLDNLLFKPLPIELNQLRAIEFDFKRGIIHFKFTSPPNLESLKSALGPDLFERVKFEMFEEVTHGKVSVPQDFQTYASLLQNERRHSARDFADYVNAMLIKYPDGRTTGADQKFDDEVTALHPEIATLWFMVSIASKVVENPAAPPNSYFGSFEQAYLRRFDKYKMFEATRKQIHTIQVSRKSREFPKLVFPTLNISLPLTQTDTLQFELEAGNRQELRSNLFQFSRRGIIFASLMGFIAVSELLTPAVASDESLPVTDEQTVSTQSESPAPLTDLYPLVQAPSDLAQAIPYLEKKLTEFEIEGGGGLLRSYYVDDRDKQFLEFKNITCIYDQAIAIVAMTALGRQETAERWMRALIRSAHPDGQFPFFVRYDKNESDPYYRTGSQMWAAYAMGFFLQKFPESSLTPHIKAALKKHLDAMIKNYWLEGSEQGTQEDTFTGGKGQYPNYPKTEGFDPKPKQWSSTKQNIDAYFTLELAGRVLGDSKYTAIAQRVKKALLNRLWNNESNEAYQGVTGPAGQDKNHALDVGSWYSIFASLVGEHDRAKLALKSTDQYLVVEEGVRGYTPYLKERGYPEAAGGIWGEGTAGVLLAKRLAPRPAETEVVDDVENLLKLMTDHGLLDHTQNVEIDDLKRLPSAVSTAWTLIALHPNGFWNTDVPPLGAKPVEAPAREIRKELRSNPFQFSRRGIVFASLMGFIAVSELLTPAVASDENLPAADEQTVSAQSESPAPLFDIPLAGFDSQIGRVVNKKLTVTKGSDGKITARIVEDFELSETPKREAAPAISTSPQKIVLTGQTQDEKKVSFIGSKGEKNNYAGIVIFETQVTSEFFDAPLLLKEMYTVSSDQASEKNSEWYDNNKVLVQKINSDGSIELFSPKKSLTVHISKEDANGRQSLTIHTPSAQGNVEGKAWTEKSSGLVEGVNGNSFNNPGWSLFVKRLEDGSLKVFLTNLYPLVQAPSDLAQAISDLEAKLIDFEIEGGGGLLRSYYVNDRDEQYLWVKDITYIYDQAAAIVAMTALGRQEIAERWMQALIRSAHPDGQFPFFVRYDRVKSDPYYRTGSQMWAAYAMGFFLQKFPESSLTPHIKAALKKNLDVMIEKYWLEGSEQGTQEDTFMGGKGVYPNYPKTKGFNPNIKKEWSSTEHNIDAYFALELAGRVLGDSRYAAIAQRVKKSLLNRLWNNESNEAYQGTSHEGPDKDHALDVASWYSLFASSVGEHDRAKLALKSADQYLVVEEGIRGYPPYLREKGYSKATGGVWGEGTAGVLLAKRLALRPAETEVVDDVENLLKLMTNHGLLYHTQNAAYDSKHLPSVVSTAWTLIAIHPNGFWNTDVPMLGAKPAEAPAREIRKELRNNPFKSSRKRIVSASLAGLIAVGEFFTPAPVSQASSDGSLPATDEQTVSAQNKSPAPLFEMPFGAELDSQTGKVINGKLMVTKNGGGKITARIFGGPVSETLIKEFELSGIPEREDTPTTPNSPRKIVLTGQTLDGKKVSFIGLKGKKNSYAGVFIVETEVTSEFFDAPVRLKKMYTVSGGKVSEKGSEWYDKNKTLIQKTNPDGSIELFDSKKSLTVHISKEDANGRRSVTTLFSGEIPSAQGYVEGKAWTEESSGLVEGVSGNSFNNPGWRLVVKRLENGLLFVLRKYVNTDESGAPDPRSLLPPLPAQDKQTPNTDERRELRSSSKINFSNAIPDSHQAAEFQTVSLGGKNLIIGPNGAMTKIKLGESFDDAIARYLEERQLEDNSLSAQYARAGGGGDFKSMLEPLGPANHRNELRGPDTPQAEDPLKTISRGSLMHKLPASQFPKFSHTLRLGMPKSSLRKEWVEIPLALNPDDPLTVLEAYSFILKLLRVLAPKDIKISQIVDAIEKQEGGQEAYKIFSALQKLLPRVLVSSDGKRQALLLSNPDSKEQEKDVVLIQLDHGQRIDRAASLDLNYPESRLIAIPFSTEFGQSDDRRSNFLTISNFKAVYLTEGELEDFYESVSKSAAALVLFRGEQLNHFDPIFNRLAEEYPGVSVAPKLNALSMMAETLIGDVRVSGKFRPLLIQASTPEELSAMIQKIENDEDGKSAPRDQLLVMQDQKEMLSAIIDLQSAFYAPLMHGKIAAHVTPKFEAVMRTVQEKATPLAQLTQMKEKLSDLAVTYLYHHKDLDSAIHELTQAENGLNELSSQPASEEFRRTIRELLVYVRDIKRTLEKIEQESHRENSPKSTASEILLARRPPQQKSTHTGHTYLTEDELVSFRKSWASDHAAALVLLKEEAIQYLPKILDFLKERGISQDAILVGPRLQAKELVFEGGDAAISEDVQPLLIETREPNAPDTIRRWLLSVGKSALVANDSAVALRKLQGAFWPLLLKDKVEKSILPKVEAALASEQLQAGGLSRVFKNPLENLSAQLRDFSLLFLEGADVINVYTKFNTAQLLIAKLRNSLASARLPQSPEAEETLNQIDGVLSEVDGVLKTLEYHARHRRLLQDTRDLRADLANTAKGTPRKKIKTRRPEARSKEMSEWLANPLFPNLSMTKALILATFRAKAELLSVIETVGLEESLKGLVLQGVIIKGRGDQFATVQPQRAGDAIDWGQFIREVELKLAQFPDEVRFLVYEVDNLKSKSAIVAITQAGDESFKDELLDRPDLLVQFLRPEARSINVNRLPYIYTKEQIQDAFRRIADANRKNIDRGVENIDRGVVVKGADGQHTSIRLRLRSGGLDWDLLMGDVEVSLAQFSDTPRFAVYKISSPGSTAFGIAQAKDEDFTQELLDQPDLLASLLRLETRSTKESFGWIRSPHPSAPQNKNQILKTLKRVASKHQDKGIVGGILSALREIIDDYPQDLPKMKVRGALIKGDQYEAVRMNNNKSAADWESFIRNVESGLAQFSDKSLLSVSEILNFSSQLVVFVISRAGGEDFSNELFNQSGEVAELLRPEARTTESSEWAVKKETLLPLTQEQLSLFLEEYAAASRSVSTETVVQTVFIKKPDDQFVRIEVGFKQGATNWNSLIEEITNRLTEFYPSGRFHLYSISEHGSISFFIAQAGDLSFEADWLEKPKSLVALVALSEFYSFGALRPEARTSKRPSKTFEINQGSVTQGRLRVKDKNGRRVPRRVHRLEKDIIRSIEWTSRRQRERPALKLVHRKEVRNDGWRSSLELAPVETPMRKYDLVLPIPGLFAHRFLLTKGGYAHAVELEFDLDDWETLTYARLFLLAAARAHMRRSQKALQSAASPSAAEAYHKNEIQIAKQIITAIEDRKRELKPTPSKIIISDSEEVLAFHFLSLGEGSGRNMIEIPIDHPEIWAEVGRTANGKPFVVISNVKRTNLTEDELQDFRKSLGKRTAVLALLTSDAFLNLSKILNLMSREQKHSQRKILIGPKIQADGPFFDGQSVSGNMYPLLFETFQEANDAARAVRIWFPKKLPSGSFFVPQDFENAVWPLPSRNVIQSIISELEDATNQPANKALIASDREEIRKFQKRFESLQRLLFPGANLANVRTRFNEVNQQLQDFLASARKSQPTHLTSEAPNQVDEALEPIKWVIDEVRGILETLEQIHSRPEARRTTKQSSFKIASTNLGTPSRNDRAPEELQKKSLGALNYQSFIWPIFVALRLALASFFSLFTIFTALPVRGKSEMQLQVQNEIPVTQSPFNPSSLTLFPTGSYAGIEHDSLSQVKITGQSGKEVSLGLDFSKNQNDIRISLASGFQTGTTPDYFLKDGSGRTRFFQHGAERATYQYDSKPGEAIVTVENASTNLRKIYAMEWNADGTFRKAKKETKQHLDGSPFEIPFSGKKGWNLISFPFSVPIEQIQNNLGATSPVWVWDGLQFQAFGPGESLPAGWGAWVFLGADIDFVWKVNQIELPRIQLWTGWNLIGSGDESLTPAQALENQETLRGFIWGWDSVHQRYTTPTSLDPNGGYWLYVSAPTTIYFGDLLPDDIAHFNSAGLFDATGIVPANSLHPPSVISLYDGSAQNLSGGFTVAISNSSGEGYIEFADTQGNIARTKNFTLNTNPQNISVDFSSANLGVFNPAQVLSDKLVFIKAPGIETGNATIQSAGGFAVPEVLSGALIGPGEIVTSQTNFLLKVKIGADTFERLLTFSQEGGVEASFALGSLILWSGRVVYDITPPVLTFLTQIPLIHRVGEMEVELQISDNFALKNVVTKVITENTSTEQTTAVTGKAQTIKVRLTVVPNLQTLEFRVTDATGGNRVVQRVVMEGFEPLPAPSPSHPELRESGQRLEMRTSDASAWAKEKVTAVYREFIVRLGAAQEIIYSFLKQHNFATPLPALNPTRWSEAVQILVQKIKALVEPALASQTKSLVIGYLQGAPNLEFVLTAIGNFIEKPAVEHQLMVVMSEDEFAQFKLRLDRAVQIKFGRSLSQIKNFKIKAVPNFEQVLPAVQTLAHQFKGPAAFVSNDSVSLDRYVASQFLEFSYGNNASYYNVGLLMAAEKLLQLKDEESSRVFYQVEELVVGKWLDVQALIQAEKTAFQMAA